MDLQGNSPRMFEGSREFSISGATFQNAGRDIITIGNVEYRGLSELSRFTSSSAFYDAEARFPPPLCHPGTREEVLSILRCWVSPIASRAPNESRIDIVEDLPSLYWLCGLEGAGKSAVAQTLAESYARSTTLAATFFFGRSDSSRNNPQRLFTTIAFQLAVALPKLRAVIESVIINNPAVLTSSIETQFDQLILRPCSQVFQEAELTSDAPSLIIIDGLDECSGPIDQRRILSAIGKGVGEPERIFPFKFLITSRPEPHIREAFNSVVPFYRRMHLEPTLKASIRGFIYILICFIWGNFLFYRFSEALGIPRPNPIINSISGTVKVALKPLLKSLAELTIYVQ
ncbi:hypothetical protein BDP27DRAFT_1291520 [Rhodocollybia butyracea]|uniref:NACHT domain-containing protein n=1 Tax=Rhodocollybia butyracea TaxID=206335 RepID=A0A9P5UAQ7_9AGAR|nr:hypothetical protein BDP27DRAFT_1291520 [Rhodocollybia butyracea]